MAGYTLNDVCELIDDLVDQLKKLNENLEKERVERLTPNVRLKNVEWREAQTSTAPPITNT